MKITIALTGVEALTADLDGLPARTTRAMVRALNRAITSARTVMVRSVAADTGLRSTDVRAAIPLSEASVSRPSAQIGASLKRLPLIQFGARGPEPSRGKGRGVSYRLQGGRSRASSAFIATMRSGHRGVFARAGQRRLPIRELFGPSLGHVFAKFKPAAEAAARESFAKNFKHEWEREQR